MFLFYQKTAPSAIFWFYFVVLPFRWLLGILFLCFFRNLRCALLFLFLFGLCEFFIKVYHISFFLIFDFSSTVKEVSHIMNGLLSLSKDQLSSLKSEAFSILKRESKGVVACRFVGDSLLCSNKNCCFGVILNKNATPDCDELQIILYMNYFQEKRRYLFVVPSSQLLSYMILLSRKKASPVEEFGLCAFGEKLEQLCPNYSTGRSPVLNP
jgi:hypothetical protein